MELCQAGGGHSSELVILPTQGYWSNTDELPILINLTGFDG